MHKHRDAAPKIKATAKRVQEKFLKIIYPQRERESPGKQELFLWQHPLEPTAGISFVAGARGSQLLPARSVSCRRQIKPSQAAAILELKAFPLPVGCSELPRRQDLLQTTHSSSHCSRTGIPCKALVTWRGEAGKVSPSSTDHPSASRKGTAEQVKARLLDTQCGYSLSS